MPNWPRSSSDHVMAQNNICRWINFVISSKLSAFIELGFKFFGKGHSVPNDYLCKITIATSEGIANMMKRLKCMIYIYQT
jgi:hypothetical protein